MSTIILCILFAVSYGFFLGTYFFWISFVTGFLSLILFFPFAISAKWNINKPEIWSRFTLGTISSFFAQLSGLFIMNFLDQRGLNLRGSEWYMGLSLSLFYYFPLTVVGHNLGAGLITGVTAFVTEHEVYGFTAIDYDLIDDQDIDGNTRLIKASANRRNNEIRELLRLGAKVDIQNKYGITAPMAAVISQNFEGLRAILKHHPDLSLKDNNGRTIFNHATQLQDLRFSKLLQKK